MNFLDHITVLMLTFNEEPNVARTLAGVAWAKKIIVIDSGSTDSTLDIVRSYSQAEIFLRPFDNHQAQWNFGLEQCGGDADWILAIDADYQLDDNCRDELAALMPTADISAYRAPFRYCVLGRPLRGNLYPPVIVLYRRKGAQYIQSGHTQRLVIAGRIIDLHSHFHHDDRKPLSRWFASQLKYAQLEADHLLSTPLGQLRWSDVVRRMAWPAPIIVPIYTLVVQRCVLDGWPGWYYVLQRALAEAIIALEIVDRGVRGVVVTKRMPPS